jgi:hypothetical protein
MLSFQPMQAAVLYFSNQCSIIYFQPTQYYNRVSMEHGENQIAFKMMTLSEVISSSCGHCLLSISADPDWRKLHCTGCPAPFPLSNPA